MSNFRTKLLGLTALATAFAGASYGQTYGVAVTPAPGALNIRAEGTNELVASESVVFTPPAAALQVTNATVTFFESAPVTSTPAAGATAANPIINASLTCGGAPIFGQLDATGKQISFANVTIAAAPATTTCTLTGVRVNANAVTASATLTTVTATAAITINGITASQVGSSTVAFVFSTLATPVVNNITAGGVVAPIPPIFTATGNPVKPTTVPSFYASMGQSLAGAFKTCQGENGDGLATFGTRVQLAIGNVPSQASVWVPTTIAVTGGWNFVLVTSPTAPDTACPTNLAPANTPATLPTATASNAAPAIAAALTYPVPAAGSPAGTNVITYGPNAAVTFSNGTGIAVYEVQAVPAGAQLKVSNVEVPVFVTLPAGALSTGTGAVTVLESYSPQAAAAAATTIPNFAVTTATPLPGVNIITSQTSLLFPYVVSQLGFDTGIAIANTSADPFGTVGSSGTCTFNVYGAAQPTPNTNIAAGGTIAPGTNGTPFLLSSIAPGFSGYMIAQCNFIDAYGYAYIEYNLTQNNGVSEGYVAVQLNRVTGAPASIGN